MEPIVANGAATILSATAAIMYPPLAATVSTQTTQRKPACLRRSSWELANPY